MRAGAPLVCILGYLWCSLPAAADTRVQSVAAGSTLHLVGGRTIQVTDCHREADELKCRTRGGTVGFALDQVERLEKNAAATPPAPAPAPAKDALPVMPVPRPRAGTELTADSARARIAELERAVSATGRNPVLLRELSLLHAWLGNTALTSNDFDGADREYRNALESDPTLMVARLNRATALINLSRYDAAEEILREILSEDSGNARALELLGESAVQTGRLDEGIALWERSLSLHPSGSLSARLARARRLQTAEEGYERSLGAHFDLRFDGGEASPDLAQEILSYLETTHAELSARFAHEPEAVIRVTLYSTRAFRDATSSPDWVGGLFDGQIRVPIRGLTHLVPQMKQVLAHELTHCFIASRSRGNAPQWIQEGMAQVVEGKTARHARAVLLAGRAGAGAEYDADFSYLKALSQTEFFLERWSGAHLNDLLDHLGRGDDIESSLRSTIGVSYAEFLLGWGDWLQR